MILKIFLNFFKNKIICLVFSSLKEFRVYGIYLGL